MATAADTRKILIALDNSGWAEAAFNWYLSTLHKEGNEVLCVYSMEPPSISPDETYGGAIDVYGEALEGCKATAKRIEDRYAQRMQANNVTGRTLTKFATKPGETIVQFAAEEEVQMIVMGSRGKGKLKRKILGSTVDYVLHHAHCPVAIFCHEHGRGRRLSSSISIDESRRRISTGSGGTPLRASISIDETAMQM